MLPRRVQMFFKAVATRPQLCKFAYTGQLYLFPILTLLIPSYFGPAFYTKGGGVIWTPYLINTWLYKPQILQGITDTLQGLRKHNICKKSFAWLPWQLFGNMVLFANNCQKEHENRYFSNAPRNHKLEGVKINLCVMIVLFSKK